MTKKMKPKSTRVSSKTYVELQEGDEETEATPTSSTQTPNAPSMADATDSLQQHEPQAEFSFAFDVMNVSNSPYAGDAQHHHRLDQLGMTNVASASSDNIKDVMQPLDKQIQQNPVCCDDYIESSSEEKIAIEDESAPMSQRTSLTGGAPELPLYPHMHQSGGEENTRDKANSRLESLRGDVAPVPLQYIADGSEEDNNKKNVPKRSGDSNPSGVGSQTLDQISTTEEQQNIASLYNQPLAAPEAAAKSVPPTVSTEASSTEAASSSPPFDSTETVSSPTPTFYAVEARLVRDSTSTHQQQVVSIPVYNAVHVPEPQPESWWKRNRFTIAICIGLMFGATLVSIAIAAIVRRDSGPSNTTTSSTIMSTTRSSQLSSTMHTTTSLQASLDNGQDLQSTVSTQAPLTTMPSSQSTSCVEFIGPLLEKDCNNCYPKVSGYNNNVAVGVGNTFSILEYPSFREIASFQLEHSVSALGINAGIAVVGAASANDNTGAAEAFKYIREQTHEQQGWVKFGDMTPSDINHTELPNAHFGSFLDVSINSVVVGADGHQYIYRLTDTNFAPEAKLDRPGSTISIVTSHSNYDPTGDGTIALGYPEQNRVLVYERNQLGMWSQSGTIVNFDCDGQFGKSIALTYDKGLFVGCPKEASETGAVFYFELDEQEQFAMKQKIQASDGMKNDDFAHSNQLVIGYVREQRGQVEGKRFMVASTYRLKHGKAYVFKYENDSGEWVEVAKVEAPAGTKHFGDQLAMMAGGKLIVSSAHNAYVYNIVEC